jgi:hypothetical protein
VKIQVTGETDPSAIDVEGGEPATVVEVTSGFVSSVNGKTGGVILGAADVGADSTGAAAAAQTAAISAAADDATAKVAAHVAAVDPHGDRAYTDSRITVDWVNVKKTYGAKGDGTTDDTAAIQAAIDSGSPVYFPPGVYLTGTLEARLGMVLIGAMRSAYAYPVPSTRSATLKLKSGTNGNLIHAADGINNVQISSLAFDGNKAGNSSGDIIHLDTASAQDTSWHISDCYFDNAPANGVFIGSGRQAVKIHRTWIMRAANAGIIVNGPDCGFNTVLIGLSGAYGMYIGNGANVQHITDCDIWSSTQHGIVVDNASMVAITGTGIDRHQQSGIVVLNGDVTIRGCMLHGNSQAANSTYPHIRVDAGNVIVSGCIFGGTTFVNNPNYAISTTNGKIRESSNSSTAQSYTTGFINNLAALIPDDRQWQPTDMGLLAWTHDPLAAAGTIASTSGSVYFMKIPIRRMTTVTNIVLTVTTAGSGLTAGQNLVGLYDSAGNRLAVSADQSTAFTTTGTKTIPLTTPLLVQPGYYYIAVMSNGTTPAALMYTVVQSAAALNLNSSLRFLNITGQTSLPATFTPGTASTGTNARWAAIS